jgi:hypothetical protein
MSASSTVARAETPHLTAVEYSALDGLFVSLSYASPTPRFFEFRQASTLIEIVIRSTVASARFLPRAIPSAR